MQSVKLPDSFWRWATILALLGGVFLRWASLGPTGAMLHHDEAWNGIDALALLRQPRLTPFLPNNFGRESGWVYWLMPFVFALGANSFTIRFAATVTGILTLAAAGRLGRELLGKSGAFWGVAALSVFYWHIHLSHQALRANFYVLLGTLTAATVLYAYRTNLRRAWIIGGVTLGLLGYTYFASAAWISYIGVLVLGVAFFDQRRRWGAVSLLLTSVVIILPIGTYLLRHPDQFLARPTAVAIAPYEGLSHNVQRWIEAWFQQGDLNHEFNLPGRPILDPVTGVLGGLGLLGLVFSFRKWSYGLILIGWGVAACLPSLLSNAAPHFLRASGMTVPVALIIGTGGQLLQHLIQRVVKIKAAAILPCLLLISVGVVTCQDFHIEWIHHPDTFVVMEQHINQAFDYLQDHAARDNHIYFSPFTPAHPVIIFREVDLAPRPVAAFDSHQCLVLPEGSTNYVSLTMYEPSFQQRIAQWADVKSVFVDPQSPTPDPRYSIFIATPYPDQGLDVASFGDALAVKLMQPISTTIAPGDTLPVVLGTQPLHKLDFAPSLFVHLYGIPTPYEGGKLWSQADSQLCVSYPAHLWRTDETIIQSFALDVSPDTPPGVYTVAIGIYKFPAGERLSVSKPGNQALNYVNLHQLTVTVK